MPSTALNHFDQDLARARALVAHADPLPKATPSERTLRSDLFRSGWMFAVGAVDAYFCDAYVDVVAVTISSKSRHPPAALPDFFSKIRFPIRVILEPYASNANWRWRMAAREMMERENVLSLETVRLLFNGFFRPGQKLFREILPLWIAHPDSTKRMFGITRAGFAALTVQQRIDAVGRGWAQMDGRFRALFQRRHDCIHNCDRPRVLPQPLEAAGTVLKVIQDVEFLVHRFDEHVTAEFRQFLFGIGCPAVVVAQAGY